MWREGENARTMPPEVRGAGKPAESADGTARRSTSSEPGVDPRASSAEVAQQVGKIAVRQDLT